MNIFDNIYRRARKNPKRIVLPEGDELRVIEAASEAARLNLARIILLGKSDVILNKARKNNLALEGIEIIDPKKDKKLKNYIKVYYELRKRGGITHQNAAALFRKNLVYFAAMMLWENRIDGFVAGACYKTSDVVRAAFRCIKKDPAYSVASGSFLVQIKDSGYGEKGLFLFADCAIVPLPNVQQLADIAITSAETWVKVTGFQPRVAMLSFSTKGSSSHPCLDKVRQACETVKKQRPDLIIDGELQVDSAVEPEVARIKAAQSPLSGRANILIFPNLEAGNIAYKLVQRLAHARVAGPLIQGLGRPCSDLSRGATPKEIVDAIAVTAVRAQ